MLGKTINHIARRVKQERRFRNHVAFVGKRIEDSRRKYPLRYERIYIVVDKTHQ